MVNSVPLCGGAGGVAGCSPGAVGAAGTGAGGAATLFGVIAPSGSCFPGQNIRPSVTLTTPATDFPTRPFLVSFYAIVGGASVFLGSFTVASVAAGTTVNLSPPVGVPLPPSVTRATTRSHNDGHVVAIRALPDYDALFGVVFDPAPTDPTATATGQC